MNSATFSSIFFLINLLHPLNDLNPCQIRADKDISEKTEETPCTRENERFVILWVKALSNVMTKDRHGLISFPFDLLHLVR